MNVYLQTIMNTFIISMGSNENRAENMSRCRYLLNKYYPNVIFSEMINTKPFGDNYRSDFYNQLAEIRSNDNEYEVMGKLKNVEQEIGRQISDKSRGIIKIDVDLLMVNEHIVKSEDFRRPYIKVLFEDLKKKVDFI